MNRLKQELVNRVVVMTKDFFEGETDRERCFLVLRGFGGRPHATGSQATGIWLEGFDYTVEPIEQVADMNGVERLATKDEILSFQIPEPYKSRIQMPV